jgi:capsid protein
MAFWDFLKANKTQDIQQGYWDTDPYYTYIRGLVPYDGEKTPYELGQPVEFWMDYANLRARAWEAYVTSDVIQNAIRKYCLWIVGSGLKVSVEPVETILQAKGITINKNSFVETTEAQFRLYSKSKDSTYTRQMNLHKMASEALKNAILAGDVLVIQRLKKGRISTQIIDGMYVQSPPTADDNVMIRDGVEMNVDGEHIAYYVVDDNNEYVRVAARNSQGMLQAWLLYGLRHKINDTRGISLLTAVLETASQLDRFKAASLGNAEENANIPYTFEHNQFSDGENPMIKQMVQSMGRDKGVAPETQTYEKCDQIADKIAVSTKKKAYNLPVGSTLKRNDFKTDDNFKDFFNINSSVVYYTIGIPPEVAEDRFGGSYSSSRAALKSWEHKMKTDRENTLHQEFYGPIYDYWFNINVMQNNIHAPGYLNTDAMGKLAYLNKRFVGVNIPHIDPVKEVNAIRTKLGKMYENIPLTTADQATEEMNTGDFTNIIKKAENEQEIASNFNLVDDGDNAPADSSTD